MINVNLIAERRARKIREMTILRTTMVVVVSLAVLMVGVNLLAVALHYEAKAKLVAVEDELLAKQPAYELVLGIEDEIREKEPLVNLLEQVQASESAWMTILTDISRILPKDVVIDNISTKTDKKQVVLELKGRARDVNSVSKLMLNLSEMTSWAETPELDSSDQMKIVQRETQKETALLRFNMTVPIRGMVGGDL